MYIALVYSLRLWYNTPFYEYTVVLIFYYCKTFGLFPSITHHVDVNIMYIALYAKVRDNYRVRSH